MSAVLQVVPAATSAPAKGTAAADDDLSDSDDDEDLDLFGDLTPEEQAAADEKKRIIEAAKKRGAEKAKLTKSMVVLDVKPWDDTTGKPPSKKLYCTLGLPLRVNLNLSFLITLLQHCLLHPSLLARDM